MTVEADITAICNPVFNERVWWDSIPDGMTPEEMDDPLVIIQQVGGVDKLYADNTVHEFQNGNLQFFVWGRRREEVNAAMNLLRKTLIDSNTEELVIIPQGAAVNDYNEVLKLRGRRQNFSVWSKDPLVV